MLYVRCMFLMLLFADWAFDTQFGNSLLSQPMCSSQVTLSQAIGDSDSDQHIDQTPACFIFPCLTILPIRLPEFASSLVESAVACCHEHGVVYLFMSLRR